MKQTYEIPWILVWVVASLLMVQFSAMAADKVIVIPLFSSGGDDKIPTVTSSTGRVWMDRNLGALRVAQSAGDHGAYGWLYQWGRFTDMHQIRYSHTATNQSIDNVPGHGHFIMLSNDWRSSPNDNLWHGVSGDNNPCPTGFRVPTIAEWTTEVNSWSSKNSAGAFASPLKFVAAGFRDYSDGTVRYAGCCGYFGRYWSSTPKNTITHALSFDNTLTGLGYSFRARGYSVRCIKD